MVVVLSKVSIQRLDKYGKYIVGATVGAVCLPFVLTAAGFTSAGIAAGSVAAGTQSAVYGGATTGEVYSASKFFF